MPILVMMTTAFFGLYCVAAKSVAFNQCTFTPPNTSVKTSKVNAKHSF